MLTTATTWAITSAQFLTAYGLLCIAAAAGIWWQWDRAVGPRTPGTDPLPDLGIYELALLGGGPQRAITSALAQLHRDKLLLVRRREGTLKVSGEPAPAEPFERAVYLAVRSEPGVSIAALRRTLKGGEELESMSAQLARDGLLLDDERAALVRRLWVVGALLTALGVARIVSGLRTGVAIGGTAAIVLVVAGATLWLFRHRPLATKRGRETLERLRAERDDLRREPVTGETAMTVALFGGGALWLADPAVASALGVPREEGAHDGGWGASRSGCGGGAGCFAGGGSSSCGSGGGGCGGGGCGGGGG